MTAFHQKLTVLFLAIVILCSFVSQGFSQEIIDKKISIIPDTTYVLNDSPSRFYFNNNGEFAQQFGEDFSDYSAGALLYGRWERNHADALCLTYDKLQQTFCFILKQENHRILLQDTYGATHFTFSRGKSGNWLFTKDGLDVIRQAYGLDRSNLPENSLNQAFLSYLSGKTIAGNILKSYGTFYFDETGDIYLVDTETNTKSQTGNTWVIKNNFLLIKDIQGAIIRFLLLTFGEEFIEPKDKKLYMYPYFDFPYIEGLDFTLSSSK